jgi:hypothetical protein
VGGLRVGVGVGVGVWVSWASRTLTSRLSASISEQMAI